MATKLGDLEINVSLNLDYENKKGTIVEGPKKQTVTLIEGEMETMETFVDFEEEENV